MRQSPRSALAPTGGKLSLYTGGNRSKKRSLRRFLWLRFAARLAAVGQGRHADSAFEHLGEMALVAKARFLRDFRKRQIRGREQILALIVRSVV